MIDRVLVTGAGGPAGTAVITLLAGMGVSVVGVDMGAVPPVAGVPVLRVPPVRDPSYLAVLAGLVQTRGIGVVIPTVSEELELLSRSAAELEPAAVVVGSPAAVGIAADKLHTSRVLAGVGVAVPRFADVADLAGPDEAISRVGHPFVLKPRVSRGGRGVAVVRNPDQLDWNSVRRSRWLVQEFAPGTEYAPMVYRSPTGDADELVVVEKLELKSGEIGNAVRVSRIRHEDAPDVAALALAAVRAFGLHGPVDLDIRRRCDGTPVVLEVNARFGANLRHAPELLHRLVDELARRPALA